MKPWVAAFGMGFGIGLVGHGLQAAAETPWKAIYVALGVGLIIYVLISVRSRKQ